MGIAIANRKNRCDFGALRSYEISFEKRSEIFVRHFLMEPFLETFKGPSVPISASENIAAISCLASENRDRRELETNLASRWEGVRFPRASGKSPDLPGSFPNFPGSFSATSPEVLSLWN